MSEEIDSRWVPVPYNIAMSAFKCVLVGEGGVGKSTYVKKLLTGRYESVYMATLGVEVIPVTLGGVRFNFWDTAGQEKFGGLRDGYYVNADCALICFDLSSRYTWNRVVNWYNDISNVTNNLVLVGFKSDLPPVVTLQEINLFIYQHNLPYCAVSTKTGGQDMTLPIAHLLELLL